MPKVKRLVPPLKDVPDEVYADSGEDSDFNKSKIELENSLRLIQRDLG